ncbi:valine--tRNA ligase [Candidatus Jorgensenbacteria bacterium]|nr:valine--tRNA ligase [Candidatus Jorgensenbacteria bacterium]
MLDKIYDPKQIEKEIYELWENSGYFNPDNLPVPGKTTVGEPNKKGKANKTKTYVIYMPLPNVTGSLHMGHALDNTLPDILIRYLRMGGVRTLWLAGTDHAGIATQYVVEKELKKEGRTRFELGREKFIERVWEWKNKYGNIILDQLKKLGISADWSRTRFTMDPSYSQDVQKAFTHYYKKGWLYRGNRTVNWCPRCSTSLSELELEYKNEKTTLFYMKYEPFTLATVRPETKFGDTALAVNPNDERYKSYIGKTLNIESLSTEGSLDKPSLTTINLKIVGDDAVDPAFGTGVVKVTPAHDITDFEIAERHKLPMVQVIDHRGRMNEQAGKYNGMKIAEAREKVIQDLRALGLMAKEEPYEHRVATCYRCGSTIEPLPSKQWFLKMTELAKNSIEAVDKKKIKIHPKRFEKPYFEWLKNIRDWTVSRQIWWGHRLPVYYCVCGKCDHATVATEPPKTKCPKCSCKEYKQDEDVLDTWFSSALWPFAGLSEIDIKNYYPGDLVSNAREILNLWDARMIFSGLEFKGKIPFNDVLIHGTILTKDGKRMSKSKGTGIDPLNYINQYGADATRFAVTWQASGQDIRWDEAAVIAGRKFTNKIWNASRFVLEKIKTVDVTIQDTVKPKTAADKKILEELQNTKKIVGKNIEKFEFSKALHELYDFFWHSFCDQYLEEAKKQLVADNTDSTTQKLLLQTLTESITMLHPFLPFITEAIYQKIPNAENKLLMVKTW